MAISKKGKFLLAGLAAVIILALPTVMNFRLISEIDCSFVQFFPFCNAGVIGIQGIAQALYVTIAVILFSIYGVFAMKNSLDGESAASDKKMFAVTAVAMALLMLAVLPFTTHDLMYYYNYGRAASQGANLYIDSYPFTDYYAHSARLETGIIYGPLMLPIFKLVYLLSQGDIMFFSFFWKLLQLFSLCVLGYLIYLAVPKNSQTVNRQLLFLFILSQPLLLWEWVGNGHFDCLWIIFLISAYLFAKSRKWWLVMVSLTIGIWIKFIPILAVPWFALWWWQEADRSKWPKVIGEAIAGIVASSLITLMAWQGLWQGKSTLEPLGAISKWAAQSLFSAIYFSLKPLFIFLFHGQAHYILTRLVHAMVLILAVYYLFPYLIKVYRIVIGKIKWTGLEYLSAIFLTLSVYLLVWQKVVWPWYLAWLVPIGFIIYFNSGNRCIRNITLWLSLAPIFIYIPWMLTNGTAYGLWYDIVAVFAIAACPLFEMYKWRKNGYSLSQAGDVKNLENVDRIVL